MSQCRPGAKDNLGLPMWGALTERQHAKEGGGTHPVARRRSAGGEPEKRRELTWIGRQEIVAATPQSDSDPVLPHSGSRALIVNKSLIVVDVSCRGEHRDLGISRLQ